MGFEDAHEAVKTSDNRNAYYAFATVPSMEPVCSFYKNIQQEFWEYLLVLLLRQQ